MDQAARPCIRDGDAEVELKSKNSELKGFDIMLQQSQNDMFESYNSEEDNTNNIESLKGNETEQTYEEIADEYSIGTIGSDSILEEIILEKEIYLLKEENERLKNEVTRNKETISDLIERLNAVEKLAHKISNEVKQHPQNQHKLKEDKIDLDCPLAKMLKKEMSTEI